MIVTAGQLGHSARRRGGVVVITLALFLGMLPLGVPEARAAERPPGLKPAPGRLAVDHPAQADGSELGAVMIPAIGLTDTVRSGVAMSVIDKGPAHWMGTSQPGGSGNVVLAGHRTTRTKPFYDLDRLNPGDLIFFSDHDSYVAIYQVTETLIVDPQDIWITYETGEPILTLFACHPKGSARYRIVVRGILSGNIPLRSEPYVASHRLLR
jgi:sortase A